MELLCIKSHSQNAVIVGRSYPLIGIRTCPCGMKLVNVGVRSVTQINRCSFCGTIEISAEIWWINKSLFAEIATKECEVQEYEMLKTL